MDLLCGLVGVAIALCAVAALGHALWTLGARVIGAMRVPEAPGECPMCAKPILSSGHFCSQCGFHLGEPRRPTLADDLEAAKRQLNRLASSGRISDASLQDVCEAIRQDIHARETQRPKPAAEFNVPQPVAPASATSKPPGRSAPAETTAAAPLEPVAFAEPIGSAESVKLSDPLTMAAPAETPAFRDSAQQVEPTEPRGLAGVLQSFMEEKNIRWGELVSGLLIVGSSVGLVISLWATLKEAIPYFPVAVFLAATAALHGAGLYTLRRWRLKATSRGLLLVSTLLVPLNVVAAIALNDRKPVYGAIDYAAVILGLAGLSSIVLSAARVLNKRNPWPMFIAVTGAAVGMSLIGRLTGAPEWRTLLLFTIPFGSFAFGAVAHVRRLAAGRSLSTVRAAQSFRFLGISLFSLVIAAALVAWKSGDVLGTLSLLSPLVSLLGATITAAGLVIQQRMTLIKDAAYRTAGTSIALGGGLLVTAAVVLAWPRPDLLIEVGLLNAAAFSVLGWLAVMPALHLFATTSLSLACLVGFHWASGRISIASATSARLSELLLEARSALLLTLLSLAADGEGFLIARTRARLHSVGYFASATLQAGVAIAIAAFAVLKGLPDQNLATAVFLLLALRWLAAAWWIRRAYASWIGGALLLAAIAHGLGMNSAVASVLEARGLRPADPWTVALLLHAAICTAYASAARLVGRPQRQGRSAPHDLELNFALVMPLSVAAVVVSALAVPAMLNVSDDRFFAHAGYAFATAAIWFIVALIDGAPVLAGAAQAIGTVGIVYGVIAHCRTEDWWSGRFIEPLHLNWQLSALAVWSGFGIAVRRAVRPFPGVSRLLQSEPLTVDRVVLGAVVAGFAATCSIAIAPGVFAQEVLVGWTGSNPLPFYLLVVAPFVIAAILTASRALFAKGWEQAAAAFALGIVIVVSVARLTVWPPGALWPGFPTPYGQGWGAGAWVALGLIALVLIAAHWERPTIATLGGIASILATLPFLVACRWDNDLATASALCWTSAVAALTVAVLWGLRAPVARISQRLGWTSPDLPAWRNVAHVRNVLVASTGFSVLAIIAGNMVSLVGEGRVTAGPLADSFFARLGPAASDAVPLAILAASFVVYAVAERDALWGMSATFLAQCAFGLVASYTVALAPQRAAVAEFVQFVQEIGLSAGVAAACWLAIETLAARRAQSPSVDERPLRAAILFQIVLTAIFASILTAGATYGLWFSPFPLFNSVRACGSPLGWGLLALAAGVWCLLRREGWPGSAVGPAILFFAAASPLAGASLAAWNGPANWLSFHAAIAGWCGAIGVAAFGALIATGHRRDTVAREARVADWTLLLTPLVVLFAFRGLWDDPLRPWWSAGSALWLSLCTMILPASAASRRRAYLSLIFAVLGSVFIGLKPWLELGPRPIDQDALDLIHIALIGAAVHALVWAAIGIFHQRHRQSLDRSASFPPPHHVVALLGTVVAALPALVIVGQRLFQIAPQAALPITPATVLGWSALALLTLLCVAALWERGTRHELPLLYALGLISLAIYFGRLDLSQHEFVVATVCSLAGYVVFTGGAWAFRQPLRGIGLRLGTAPADDDGEGVHRWLTAANLVASVPVIVTGFWIVLTFPEPGLRMGAALATLALAPGLAQIATGPRQRAMQTDALVVGAIAAVQLGWALMDVGPVPHEELRRTIRLMVTLAATAFVYGVPLVRLVPAASSWFVSIRRVAVGVAGAAAVSLGLILVFEIVSFDPSVGTAVTVAESAVVAVALAGLAAGLISLAVLPGRDPFLATEEQRFLYIYASEAVAGLLFAHLYLTNPLLFRHLLQPYWPLVVMGIAFCGTGISELFGRLRVYVLAKPVEYTAAFLPVLPVAGFWLVHSDLSYSTTLVAVGVLYLFLSLRRRSFVYSAAAAIVGNATLCSLFAEHGVSLLVHPQMFIIPPCVTVLAAAQLNRSRLGESALAAVRYFAITTIYVSSTGEMFQHGIGTTLWLPMVLAGLSVLGVLAGIMVRVRAFLYLGTSFLLLSLVSMVWHASRSIGHVWPWWVFLFTLGLALLTLFGIFEKKRVEVLALIDRLRQWEK